MDLIIQPEEVGILARPISQHIDREQISSYIMEAELLIVRPMLGGFLTTIKEKPNDYEVILNGGEELAGGLRRAVAYYTYARYIRYGGTIATRFGAVEKTDEYSTRLEQDRKNAVYRECCNIADAFMREVVDYSRDNGFITTSSIGRTRRSVYIIGDDEPVRCVKTPKKKEEVLIDEIIDGVLIIRNTASVENGTLVLKKGVVNNGVLTL